MRFSSRGGTSGKAGYNLNKGVTVAIEVFLPPPRPLSLLGGNPAAAVHQSTAEQGWVSVDGRTFCLTHNICAARATVPVLTILRYW